MIKSPSRFLLLPVLLLLANSLTACTILEDILAGLAAICDTDPLIVTKTDDTNDGLCTAADCSLREAVITANACPGHQTIQLPAGGYHLTRLGADEDAADTGDLDITDDASILGAGIPSIHGEDDDRVFEIFDPAVVELEGLLIVEGNAQLGAGIRNHGEMILRMSAVNNNHAEVPPGGVGTSGGGGLFNDQGAMATVLGVQFLENTADSGAAIHNFAVGDLYYEDGMMAGNIATMDGGGLWNNFQAQAEIIDVDFLMNEADQRGAAVMNDGHLEMMENKFEENTEANEGGGLWNGPDGEAFLYDAWFTNNNADLGGAVFNQGLVHLYQTGVNNNTAFGGFGGGAYNDGPGAALLLRNVTVSGNMIVPAGSPGGSGVYNAGGDVRLEFTTFAHNNNDGVYNDGGFGTIESSILSAHAHGNCSGDPMNSNGWNLEDTDVCNFIEPSDLINTAPLIGPLASNGGFSLTHALTPGSPAIDTGDPDTCIASDQRNVARPQGARCDRGAYEAEDVEPPAGPSDIAPAPTEGPTSTPWPPIVINFNADRYEIFAGECTTLRWAVENAEMVYYEGIAMPAVEAEQVCPPETMQYMLTAENPDEEAEAFVLIEVLNAPPEPPTRLNTSSNCTANGYFVMLVWHDESPNEDGFRIFRDGVQIGSVGPNIESFNDEPGYGGPFTYGVEAYNASGASSRPTVVEDGCLY